jgi:hypothetical protein
MVVMCDNELNEIGQYSVFPYDRMGTGQSTKCV